MPVLLPGRREVADHRCRTARARTLDERLAEERPDNRPTNTGADDGAAPGPAEEAAVRVRDDTPRGR
ncbi:hypothetical protein [Streptomyces sp. NPDC001657]|uniref:hypothetical protein n=1 Tax=Streptomyces sp. NPDC001657 TaxID=3154522 RepID=UPI00331B2ABF